MCVIDDKFIFVHIPKTAGSSISAMLKQRGTDGGYHTHILARELQQDMGAEYDRAYKFSFVRNPYSRMLSLYNFTKSRFEQFPERYAEYESFKRGDHLRNFNSWLLETEFITPEELKLNPNAVPAQRRSQMMWLTNAAGDIIVDKIGKVENLAADWKHIYNKIRVGSMTPPRLNTGRTNNNSYRQSYSPEAKKHIEKYFASDLEYFNYDY